MVACTYHCTSINYRSFCYFCRFNNSTIRLYFILKAIIGYIRLVGMTINKMIVYALLTLFYGFVILPYHLYLTNKKREVWSHSEKKYSQKDFFYMG